ncbi:radical SAM protein [candidate division WS5 bacterium]|uniref:Radical SAM protein n=1 Tax=candidate division WS5 bacterium TaxID=2093353 RepID=A0A419D9Z9_9BACT|nr:MAG: radical SAM protein [candidate division WS5 bacterium]
MITLINHQGLKLVDGIQIQSPAPPMGLAYIGGYLKKNGYDYTAIDACGEALDQIYNYERSEHIKIQGLTLPQIVERLPENTKIVGFTCSFSHCWPLVEEIAAMVRKKLPGVVIAAGGEHPSAMPEHVFRKGIFDVVIVGEGEETFLELVKKIGNNQSWHEIEGITYKTGHNKLVFTQVRQRIKDLNSLPYPDWDNWCINKYIEYEQVSGINLGKSMPILGSRGCPYACTFCSNEHMWTRRYIMRDGKAIVDEMEHMKKKYNVSSFSFFDSTFIINYRKMLEFCEHLILRNLNITYQLPAGTRCEVFDDELAFKLEKSGLKNFSFAPESGSDIIRKAVNKQIKLDTFFKAVRAVKKTKMTVGCFIVIGFPEDTEDTIKQTLSFVRKLALIGVDDITVSKFTPYPGSVYFKTLYEKGVISRQLDELQNIISFFNKNGISYSDSLSPLQTYRWMNWLYVNFYLIGFIVRPWKVVVNFWNYYSKGVETTRYMRFFSEFFVKRKKWKKTKFQE